MQIDTKSWKFVAFQVLRTAFLTIPARRFLSCMMHNFEK